MEIPTTPQETKTPEIPDYIKKFQGTKTELWSMLKNKPLQLTKELLNHIDENFAD